MKLNRWVLLSVFVAVVAGAGWLAVPLLFSRPSIEVVGFPPLHYPGFQTWPTLRDFDGPGTIFAISDGDFDIKDKISVSPTIAGTEIIGELESTGDWNASVLEKFLGKTLHLNAQSDSKIAVEFKPEGVQRWRVAAEGASDQIRDIVRRHKGITLYLITEAISLQSVTYNLNRGLLVQAEPTLKKENFGTVELKQSNKQDSRVTVFRRFDHPFYLFYRAKKITLLSGLAEAQILTADVDTDLRWAREARPSTGLVDD